MPNYTLTPLPCWEPGCPETFAVFTDVSTHHLDAHERDLYGHPVAAWLARDGAPPWEHVSLVLDGTTLTMAVDGTPLATTRMPPFPEAPVQRMPPGSVLEAFWRSCQAEGLPYDEAARHLLDTLGIPPDAPAERFVASLAEALQRWRDRQTPAPRHAP